MLSSPICRQSKTFRSRTPAQGGVHPVAEGRLCTGGGFGKGGVNPALRPVSAGGDVAVDGGEAPCLGALREPVFHRVEPAISHMGRVILGAPDVVLPEPFLPDPRLPLA